MVRSALLIRGMGVWAVATAFVPALPTRLATASSLRGPRCPRASRLRAASKSRDGGTTSTDFSGGALQRAAVLAAASGSWAGYENLFNALSGAIKPLDDYADDGMIEWGTVPAGW